MDEHKEQEAISLLKMIYVQIGQIDKYIYMFKDSYNHYIINIEKNNFNIILQLMCIYFDNKFFNTIMKYILL